MGRFWRVRLLTLAWGFGVTFGFTGSLIGSAVMFSLIVAGNTLIMWVVLK